MTILLKNKFIHKHERFKSGEVYMLEDKEVNLLTQILDRIFSFPITKMTFKEVQRNVFTVVGEDREKANQVLKALVTGQLAKDSSNAFRNFVEEFGVRARLSRDVLEKGEFINFLSSDLINPSNPLFVNQIRRMDGQEFQFLTEPEGILHLIRHFIGRVEEFNKADQSKNFIKNHAGELEEIKNDLDKLMA